MSRPTWIGHTLGGRYEILELLGQGGMSAVYKANDPNLRRVVAVKLIHSHLSDNPEFVRRFEEEAAAVASLRHPNIIQVYDFNHDGPTYYIVFEFIPGETLQIHLQRLNEADRLMPYEQTVEIATNVADALSYAHNRGMVHRDVKPANVMLNVQGQAILMDFGVVKIVGGGTHTATGAVLGTATYMSPEQIRSEKVDARSDIYSVGVMLFEMASARPPFQADSAMTMMMMHINDPVPDLWTIRQDVPGDLAEIIYKALAKDPAERYQTASEMVSALREASLEPPSDQSTVIIPPAGVLFAEQNTGATVAEVLPDTQTATSKSTGLGRNKIAIIGGIVGIVLLLLCIVSGVVALSNGLFSGDGNQGTLKSGTAIVAVVDTEESESIGTNVAMESPTLTPADTLVFEQPSPIATETPALTSAPSITATGESEDSVEPTPTVLPYVGVELNILTNNGFQAGTLQRRGPEFEALTGAKVNVISVPRGDLYEEILTDSEADSQNYDAWVVLTQWLYDFIVAGYADELTGEVATDTAIDWEDIVPFFREFTATVGDSIYGIPLRGNVILGYYRSDLLEEAGLEPPKTWDEYLEIAALFHGQDLNEDGEPDFGSCIPRNFSKLIFAIASPMLQSQGTSQGIFFNAETLEPQIDNEAFRKALDIYGAANQYGPPDDSTSNDNEMLDMFIAGRCAFSIYGTDLGARIAGIESSIVKDKTGAMVLPGSTEVIDHDTGILVECDAEICPYAIDGVNYAPFTANIGWSGGINADADDIKKSAAYDFLSYMSQPAQSNEDVTIYDSGFTPYRSSQITNPEPWVDAGMSQQVAASYLSAIRDSLDNPNIVLDLLIPQNQRYQSFVYNPALNRYLRGEISQDETIRQVYNGWEQITNELGRADQLAAYRESLGLE